MTFTDQELEELGLALTIAKRMGRIKAEPVANKVFAEIGRRQANVLARHAFNAPTSTQPCERCGQPASHEWHNVGCCA